MEKVELRMAHFAGFRLLFRYKFTFKTEELGFPNWFWREQLPLKRAVKEDDEHFTPYGRFQTNLNVLLFRTLYNEGVLGFNSTTIGENPDKVYGLFLCRGDVASDLCPSCIDVASHQIIEKCPGRKRATIWFDECFVRYSDTPFFSILDSPSFYMWNTQNVSETDGFNQQLENMLNQLTTRAAFDPAARMFATGEVNFTEFRSIYGLAQCTSDLSRNDCNTCLLTAISYIPICCDGKQGGRVIGQNCYVRYEIYPFYRMPNASAKAPAPVSIPPPTNTTLINGKCFELMMLNHLMNKLLFDSGKKEISQEVSLLDFGVGAGTKFSEGYTETRNQMESQDFPLISLHSVQTATNNFIESNKLGEGGFGPVYRGVLPDGKEIAVKRLSRNSGQGLVEFKNEVVLIAKLQHRNLVRLLGCCIEKNEKLLVYEYMPNTSLDVFLFDPTKRVQLDWKLRFSIISGIARGLLYLHEDSRLRIIHRDLKASNVLLDNDMNPKISDFGMARIFGGNQSQANTNRVVGTYGYMAPEYAMEGLFSVKSDVFSFGVILLEIVSGKRNSGFHLSEHAQSLLTYAWRLWSESKGLEFMDPLLVGACAPNEVIKCIHVGLLCVQEDAADRPAMSSVVLMLRSDSTTLPRPTQPAFSVGRNTVGASKQSSETAQFCSVNEVTVSNVSPR
ncbi:PREDICTED: cysteine-rich receptor-like protein kinase 10 [Nelumbo nucifera]|uniref:non-specific serine/threonine protein kinase n=1 Tax=Nelumbo nucifera TaxID=4432 RepID=A0A1U8ANX3_NELNU|nr:PREDICTED: cysteine-rich receptor-like protein kinase 10 [Nelumbo nucifera]